VCRRECITRADQQPDPITTSDYTRTNTNTDVHSDTHTYSDAHLHSDRHSDSYTHSDTVTNARADTRSDRDTNVYARPHRIRFIDSYERAERHRRANRLANTHTGRITDCFAN
jgi:hypothetical protein